MKQSADFNEHNDMPLESQENPFSADLKEDFSSTFEPSSNPVMQFFKGGGFGGENRPKVVLLIGVLVLLLAGGYLLFSESNQYDNQDLLLSDEELLSDDFLAPNSEPSTLATQQGSKKEDLTAPSRPLTGGDGLKDDKQEGAKATKANSLALPHSPQPAASENSGLADRANLAAAMEAGVSENSFPFGEVGVDSSSGSPASEPPVLSSPAEGALRNYDETTGAAEFSWQGSPGGFILFSRSLSMSPISFKVAVAGNRYKFRRPYPGRWYWQVKNGAGASKVRSFWVEAPARRALALLAPKDGTLLAGTGGQISWTGDQKVAYYRVELSQGQSWANPAYRFATSATQLQLQNVPAGQYQLRLGAFSEVAGRWEYTPTIQVTVQ